MKPAVNTKVLSGFMELSPPEYFIFESLLSDIRAAYKRHNFVPLDTPAIERAEVLLSKSGGETEKQIYYIDKDGHGRDMALRFDLTIPFARYVAENYGALRFPFKRYQVDKVWRGERAQKGRYREFYQADVDIVAENELSVYYDAEIIATICDALKGVPPFKFHISNRQVWDNAGLSDRAAVLALVDRRMKMQPGEFDAEVEKLADAKKVRAILDDKGKDCADLQVLYNILKDNGVPVEIDMSIVRGLDYYTGNVFETFVEGSESLGSIASGGRYANLVGNFIGRNIIGVGGSIGVSRVFELLKSSVSSNAVLRCNTVIIPVTPAQNGKAFQLAMQGGGRAVYAAKAVKKPFEIADKYNADLAIVINENGEVIEKTILR
jgi:histidyl-tRNA synthetase